jgi:hypothetical protein
VAYDREKAAELVLALMQLTLHDQCRAWKGFDWDVLALLHEQGLIKRLQSEGEVVTGLLFVEDDAGDMHALNGTVARPLYDYPYEHLCPGSAALEALMDELA